MSFKGSVNYHLKKLITVGKEVFRIDYRCTLLYSFFFIFVLLYEVFEVGKKGEESKILLLSVVDALVFVLSTFVQFLKKLAKEFS